MSEIERIKETLAAVTMSEGITEYLDSQDIALIIQALQEKLERENQKPLTLEELNNMDGEPVWIEVIGKPDLNCWGYHDEDGVNGYTCFTSDEDYGKTWLAYRHKPEHIGEATNMVEGE